MQLTLVRDSEILPCAVPLGVELRQITQLDIGSLGALYLQCYGSKIAGSFEESVKEIRDSLSGEYGNFLPDASFVAVEN